MTTKAILATLCILGSSTAALADNHLSAERRDVDGAWMRDHRRHPVWQTLSTNDRLSRGRDFIPLATAGAYRELKLEATSGKLEITKVVIKFDNGSSQVVKPEAVLDRSSPSLTIDLAGNERHVASVLVLGNGNRRAAFAILGA